MKLSTSTNQTLLKIGGWGGILSGLFFLITTAYIFGFLLMIGFDLAMFDDHTLLHPWVAENTQVYQISWLLYLFTQLCLLPVPLALANYLCGDDDKQMAFAQLSQTLGIAAITIAIVSPAILYAAAPLTGAAYVNASGSVIAQSQVLLVSELVASTSKHIRLFSEILLGGWLLIVGTLFLNANRGKAIGWLTAVVGCWTLITVTIKIFDPLTPLEDSLGIVLALVYIPLGMHLLRTQQAQRHMNNSSSTTLVVQPV